MKRSIALLAISLASLLVISPALAQKKGETAKASLSKDDAKRLEKLAQGDLAEISAGKSPRPESSSEAVKKFKQHMVDEHSKMLDEGGKLAKSKGVTPPSSPDKKHQDTLKKLEGLSGDQFDRAFMSQMVNDHKDALKLVKETESKAKDVDLKALAQKARPHVEEHLRMAQSITSRPGKSGDKGAAFAPDKSRR